MSLKRNAVRSWANVGSWAIILGCSGLIVYNSLPYYVTDRMPFLLERPELTASPLWKSCLLMHVTGGLVCLAVGPALLSNAVILRSVRLHRCLGRIYLLSALGWTGPTGLYLSITAKGGFLGQLGFLVTGLLWLTATAMGWREIRRGSARKTPHGTWMVRSYAIAISAIFFRLFQFGLYLLHVPDRPNYIASLWLSLAASLALGQYLATQVRRRGRATFLTLSNGATP